MFQASKGHKSCFEPALKENLYISGGCAVRYFKHGESLHMMKSHLDPALRR